jgi:hypothetical protein
MTLLRHTPREVYRVDDEEDFWRDAERELRAVADGSVRVQLAPALRRHALRRLAVSSVLLAAGASGGLVAVGGSPFSGAGDRMPARFALGRSTPLRSTHQAEIDVTAESNVSVSTVTALPRVRSLTRRRRARRASGAIRRHRTGAQGQITQLGSRASGAPVEVANVNASARMTMAAAAVQSRARPTTSVPARRSSEFGFEH